MTNSRTLIGALLAALLAALPVPAASQTLGSYDTFTDAFIDFHKWRGDNSSFVSSFGVRNTEVTRRILSGQVELDLRTFGETATDTGVSGTGRNQIAVKHAALLDADPEITAVQVRITPKAAIAEDCSANTAQSASRASVFAFFFNDGTANATAGDLVGDIIAGVHLERNSKLGDRIVAWIGRCDQGPCQTSVTLKGVQFARAPWQINVPETVTVRWRQATKDFKFTVASGVGTESQVLTYGDMRISDRERPKIGTYVPLRVQNTVQNCTAGRIEGYFRALFDNAKLNAEAIAVLGP